MKTKAEISTSMIIGIIIVVLTFTLLAIFYSELTWSGDTDREVCKTSAMLRGSILEGKTMDMISSKDIISLKCKTKKICVTTNTLLNGKCEEVFGTSEGKYSTYRISKDKDKAEQQIKTLLAREMADCWDMLGRGSYSIFNREMTTRNDLGAVAVVCSRIRFDETITGNAEGQLNIKEISGFNQYLLSHKVPNHEISYWDFLRNAYDGETMAILSGQMVKGSEESYNFLNEKLDITDTKTIVFMEVRPSLAGALIGAGITGTVGAIGGGYVAGVKGFFIGATAGAGIGLEAGDWIQSKYLNEKNGLFSDGTSAAGIFLTDYNMKGFQEILPNIKDTNKKWFEFWRKDISTGFEIASYA